MRNIGSCLSQLLKTLKCLSFMSQCKDDTFFFFSLQFDESRKTSIKSKTPLLIAPSPRVKIGTSPHNKASGFTQPKPVARGPPLKQRKVRYIVCKNLAPYYMMLTTSSYTNYELFKRSSSFKNYTFVIYFEANELKLSTQCECFNVSAETFRKQPI